MSKEKSFGAMVIRCDHKELGSEHVRCTETFTSFSEPAIVEYQAQIAGWIVVAPKKSGEHACRKHKVGKKAFHVKHPFQREDT